MTDLLHLPPFRCAEDGGGGRGGVRRRSFGNSDKSDCILDWLVAARSHMQMICKSGCSSRSQCPYWSTHLGIFNQLIINSCQHSLSTGCRYQVEGIALQIIQMIGKFAAILNYSCHIFVIRPMEKQRPDAAGELFKWFFKIPSIETQKKSLLIIQNWRHFEFFIVMLPRNESLVFPLHFKFKPFESKWINISRSSLFLSISFFKKIKILMLHWQIDSWDQSKNASIYYSIPAGMSTDGSRFDRLFL